MVLGVKGEGNPLSENVNPLPIKPIRSVHGSFI